MNREWQVTHGGQRRTRAALDRALRRASVAVLLTMLVLVAATLPTP